MTKEDVSDLIGMKIKEARIELVKLGLKPKFYHITAGRYCVPKKRDAIEVIFDDRNTVTSYFYANDQEQINLYGQYDVDAQINQNDYINYVPDGNDESGW